MAIAEKGQTLVCIENKDGYTHAENLHVFIANAFKQCNYSLKDVKAISVSEGPGSYTGLRIGMSAAKGICYALKIPLITLNTLQVMTTAARLKSESEIYIPLMDARRMEVYTAAFDQFLRQVNETRPLIIDEQSISAFGHVKKKLFFGDGMPKCRELLSTLGNSSFLDGIYPSAEHMSNLSWQKFQNSEFSDPAYTEPNYLKEFVTTKSKK